MDLPDTARRGRVPGRGARLAAGQRAPGRCRPATPATGFAAHLEWERAAVRRPAGRSCPGPRRYGGRDASLWEWLIFEEEYYAAGGAAAGHPERHLPARPDACSSSARPSSRTRILPRMAAAEDLWCQGWSEPGAGSDLAAHHQPRRARRGDGGWRLNGQKTWTTRGAFCTHLFGLFRTDPSRRPPPRASPTSWSRSTPPGVTVRGFGRLDGDEGFAEVFFDDVVRPRRRGARRGRQGLAGGHGHHRLRARPDAALAGPVPGRRRAAASRSPPRQGDRLGPPLRERVARAWIGAQAYQLFTLAPGDRPASRAAARRPVQPQQAVLVRAGHRAARDRPGPARRARRSSTAPWTPRLPCSPWPARSTPAPTRSSATSSPSACSACPGAWSRCGSR